jgi:putative effector of murein hydrolase LrgA (UPF0299 family)
LVARPVIAILSLFFVPFGLAVTATFYDAGKTERERE